MEIELSLGWNTFQVPQAVAWKEAQVRTIPDSWETAKTMTWGEAQKAGMAGNQVWWYDPEVKSNLQYTWPNGILQPGVSYQVRAYSPCILILPEPAEPIAAKPANWAWVILLLVILALAIFVEQEK